VYRDFRMQMGRKIVRLRRLVHISTYIYEKGSRIEAGIFFWEDMVVNLLKLIKLGKTMLYYTGLKC
jgi:hypothetical protein